MEETYLISYDASDSDSFDYDKLHEAIKGYNTWAHITESLWAIKTTKSPVEIRDYLKTILPKDSRILVVKSGMESAWTNVMCSHDWLKKHL